MVIAMAYPQRKRQRLKNFDYSSPGCYFVTIATDKKQQLFWYENEINRLGKIIEEKISCLPKWFDFIKIDNYVIMPDHIHLLITIGCDALPNTDEWLMADLKNTIIYPNLQDIVGTLKSFTTGEIHKIYPGLKVWQKSYYDHIITNQKDYDETWDYIEANPVRWKIKHEQIKCFREF